jgi:hypothetical protein
LARGGLSIDVLLLTTAIAVAGLIARTTKAIAAIALAYLVLLSVLIFFHVAVIWLALSFAAFLLVLILAYMSISPSEEPLPD